MNHMLTKRVVRLLRISLTAGCFLFAGQCLAQSASQNYPLCLDSSSDPDNDGFGWENNSSCRVSGARPARPACRSSASDPDGDGFGWEQGKTCVVVNAKPDCTSAAVDPDGDGFGWENSRSCVVRQQTLREEKYPIPLPACSDNKYDPDRDGKGLENSRLCNSFNVGDGGRSITDVVLITGQSNALGAETARYDPASYDETLDSPVKRVYVYTKTGWSIASLRQIWDLNWYPRGDIASDPANNFGFHFGKNVVLQDPRKVIGLVVITAPGEQISHWDKGSPFYKYLQRKADWALAALPHKNKIDAILWHQGESDYYDTAYYGEKLSQLIGNLRSEAWVREAAPFVCGETYQSPVNRRLSALNNDGDPMTACVTSSGLDTIGDDVHFSAASLRVLGARYAAKYLKIGQ